MAEKCVQTAATTTMRTRTIAIATPAGSTTSGDGGSAAFIVPPIVLPRLPRRRILTATYMATTTIAKPVDDHPAGHSEGQRDHPAATSTSTCANNNLPSSTTNTTATTRTAADKEASDILAAAAAAVAVPYTTTTLMPGGVTADVPTETDDDLEERKYVFKMKLNYCNIYLVTTSYRKERLHSLYSC